MELCSNGHEEICYEVRFCPLCEMMEEKEDIIKEKEEVEIKLETLEDKLDEIYDSYPQLAI